MRRVSPELCAHRLSPHNHYRIDEHLSCRPISLTPLHLHYTRPILIQPLQQSTTLVVYPLVHHTLLLLRHRPDANNRTSLKLLIAGTGPVGRYIWIRVSLLRRHTRHRLDFFPHLHMLGRRTLTERRPVRTPTRHTLLYRLVVLLDHTSVLRTLVTRHLAHPRLGRWKTAKLDLRPHHLIISTLFQLSTSMDKGVARWTVYPGYRGEGNGPTLGI
jgi:hypothetical protein